MSQKPKTFEEIKAILDDISFLDREIRLLQKGTESGLPVYLAQLVYDEPDVEDPSGLPKKQASRKWYISPYSTKTEIVETAYAACLRSMKHIVREWFLYKGRRVMSPHFDVEARVELCDLNKYDVRED